MTARPERPWFALALVVVGGACGAAAREAMSLAIPPVDDVPIVIPIVNVVGAFVLGFVYEALTRPGIDRTRRVHVRLLVGTGLCGGFTTYSSLATGTAVLSAAGRHGVAAVFAVSTLVVGALATSAGIALGASTVGRAGRVVDDSETWSSNGTGWRNE